jgi:hypothetical protein
MTTFKQFLKNKLYTESRETTPIGTISSKEAENKIPKKLNPENIDKYLSQGFINVYRTEDFSMFLTPRNRGIYYFIGDENDTKLELGKCLIAQTKVHAAHLLGFNKKFILKKLNYYTDTPKDERSSEKEDQLLQPFLTGTRKVSSSDQFDYYITSAAKYQEYDTIIILNEPIRNFRTGTELIDLRKEVIPQSIQDLQQDE